MTWAPRGFRGKRTFAPGQAVEVRPLPGQKEWEPATYVRRIRADEMPATWRGPLGHVVELPKPRFPGDSRQIELSGARIRAKETT